MEKNRKGILSYVGWGYQEIIALIDGDRADLQLPLVHNDKHKIERTICYLTDSIALVSTINAGLQLKPKVKDKPAGAPWADKQRIPNQQTLILNIRGAAFQPQ
jgi:hypothetical protein